jgi:drug/metabolite transporter (DMT)-like permease
MSFIKSSIDFSPNTKSILWALAWGIFFSLTMSLVKFLSSNIAPLTLVMVRLFFGFLFFSPFILKTGVQQLKTQRFFLHFLRASFTALAMLCTYYTYAHLPLALATSVGFTGPLMTVLLASFIFKEKISPWQWFALILGYLGVLMMIKPQSFIFNVAILVALLGNGVTSCVVILTKYLSKTESTLKIMAYSTSLSFLLIGSIFAWTTSLPNQEELFLLAIGGALGLLSQFCYIQALKYGQPSMIAPFEYIRLVIMIPLGYFLFDESVSLLTLCGSLVIIATTYYMTISRTEKIGSQKKQTGHALAKSNA